MIDLSHKTVLLTGGDGFIGRHIRNVLEQRQCKHIIVPRHSEFDLRYESIVRKVFVTVCPDVVIHLAGIVGGIGANQANPGQFFYDNAIMGLLVQEYARRACVEKFVGVGTVCEYPRLTPVPFMESDLWNGYPEITNAPYGIAKRLLLTQGQAYRAQYGFHSVHVLPTNLYGPGDNFNLDSSHVIPALIRRCFEAIESGAEEIVCWGTGQATREFMHVKDAAEAIVRAAERYDMPEPLNIGTEQEISIAELAMMIAKVTGYTGSIRFDSSKPDGQPRRCLDASRMRALLVFEPTIALVNGLRETVHWYAEHRATLSGARA